MPKIIHQRKKCIGCGACAAICPDFFEMDEKDFLANLKKAKNKGEDFELEVEKIGCAKDAVETCPVGIIKINQ